jgi:hypothetical protein
VAQGPRHVEDDPIARHIFASSPVVTNLSWPACSSEDRQSECIGIVRSKHKYSKSMQWTFWPTLIYPRGTRTLQPNPHCCTPGPDFALCRNFGRPEHGMMLQAPIIVTFRIPSIPSDSSVGKSSMLKMCLCAIDDQNAMVKDEAMVICDGVLTEGGAKITLAGRDCLTHPAAVSTTILFPHGALPCGTELPCLARICLRSTNRRPTQTKRRRNTSPITRSKTNDVIRHRSTFG